MGFDFASLSWNDQDLRVLNIVGHALRRNIPFLTRFLWNGAGQLLKIRDKHGDLKALVPNKAQAEFARYSTGRDIVLKARQLGMTTFIAARHFILTVTRPGTMTVLVAHDQKSGEEIFRIVHRFVEYLPNRMRNGALITSRANVGQIVFPKLDSEYRVETAADPSAGRGLTIHNLHCSEVARWPRDAAATLASLRAAVPPDGRIVLESTPNGAAGCFYEEWERAEESGFCKHFFPWWYEKAYRLEDAAIGELTREEHELIRKHRLTNEQIAYRRYLQGSFRGLMLQEYAEDAVSCFVASGECVFDLDVVQKRLTECTRGRGLAHVATDNGRLHEYWPARPGASYIIGVDPAGGGSGGDFACAEVIDRISGMQCAELHGHFPPREMASRVAALGHEYNNALIAVERNNHGHAVLAHLDASEHYDGARLYEQKGLTGWLTTAVSRPRMIEQFSALLWRQPELFSSPRLLAECRTFTRHEDGFAAAAQGTHDDCVMAMAIAQAVRMEQAGRHHQAKEVEFASMER